MNIGNRFLSGIIFGVSGTILRVLLNLLLIPLMIRFLGMNNYGLYLFLLNISDILVTMDIGLTNGLIHRLSHHMANIDTPNIKLQLCLGQWLYAGISVLILLGGALSVPFLPFLFHFDTSSSSSINIFFILVVIDAAINLYGCYFQSILKAHCLHQWTNISETFHAILINAFSVALLALGFGLLQIFIMRLVVTMLKNIYLLYGALKVEPLTLQANFNVSWQGLKELFGISFYAMIMRISTFISYRIDFFVIASYLTMTDVGLYGLVTRLFNNVTDLCVKFTDALLPIFTRLTTLENRDQARFFFLRINAFVSYLVIVLLAMILFNYPQIIHFIGSGKISVSQILPVTLIVMPLTWSTITQNPSNNYLFAAGYHRLQTFLTLAAALLNLIISVILVRYLGILGVALGTLIPNIIQQQVITVIVTCHKLNISFWNYLWVTYIKNLLSLGVLFTLLFLGKHIYGGSLYISVLITGFAVVMSAVTWLFTSASSYEKERLMALIQRPVKPIPLMD